VRKYGAELESTSLLKTMRKLKLGIFMVKFPAFAIKKRALYLFKN